MWYLLKVEALIAGSVFFVAGLMILVLLVWLKVKAYGALIYRLYVDASRPHLHNVTFSKSGRGYAAVLLAVLLWPVASFAADNDNPDNTLAAPIGSVSEQWSAI
jgi:hypothetical protein